MWQDLTPEGRTAVLRQTAEADQRLSSRTPVLAITKYLERFPSGGRLVGEVLKAVMGAMLPSLDDLR